MFDILTALQYGELAGLHGKAPMEAPYTIAEERILRQLHALEPEAADDFRHEIQVLAQEQRDAAFHTGVRFGAQLMAQLLEDF
nr:hypothetical protein [uncultured Oscillibacter sp.]